MYPSYTIRFISIQFFINMPFNVNNIKDVPMSVQLVSCPPEWTQEYIVELFYINNIGHVSEVKYVQRTNGTMSAYINLDVWFSNEETCKMICNIMFGFPRQYIVHFPDDSEQYVFKKIPNRAKKVMLKKQEKRKMREIQSDSDLFDTLLKEMHRLILHEQVNDWTTLACVSRF